jgi:hypothetical protein
MALRDFFFFAGFGAIAASRIRHGLRIYQKKARFRPCATQSEHPECGRPPQIIKGKGGSKDFLKFKKN